MSYPSGPQWGIPYTLTGPDGAIAVFNDDTSPYYVGMLSPESSGLDSADVRENASDQVEADGGIHGNFYYGRRPIVLQGNIIASSAVERNERIARLKRASNAMREDAILTFEPDGGLESFVKVRRQQPLRITKGWAKEFQLPLVAADPRIYGTTLTTVSAAAGGEPNAGRTYSKAFDFSYGAALAVGQIFITNNGDAESPPIIKVYGPGVNPSLYNATTNETISLVYSLAAGEYLEIDLNARTVLLNGTTNRYSAVDFANTHWWMLQPDQNDIRLGYFSFEPGAKFEISYRDAWI